MARKRKISESDFLDSSTSDSESGSQSMCKRPLARNAANARERARMRVLSKAFTRLKTSLPWVPADTKLSKLDTLRLAASYISHLKQILAEDNAFPTTPIHPLNLTWPFTLHNRPSNHQDDTSTVTDSTCALLHPFSEPVECTGGVSVGRGELIYQQFNQHSSNQCYQYF